MLYIVSCCLTPILLHVYSYIHLLKIMFFPKQPKIPYIPRIFTIDLKDSGSTDNDIALTIIKYCFDDSFSLVYSPRQRCYFFKTSNVLTSCSPRDLQPLLRSLYNDLVRAINATCSSHCKLYPDSSCYKYFAPIVHKLRKQNINCSIWKELTELISLDS